MCFPVIWRSSYVTCPVMQGVHLYQGCDHSTKISGNFGLKLNGSVQSNRKSFEKSGPPFEVDHFSWLDRSYRNGPFHLTIPTHSQSQDLAVQYLPCTKWWEILITALLWIANGRSIGVTCTSMYSYHRSVAALRAKCMFWLLMALKDDLIPERIWNVLFVIQFERGVWSYVANIWEPSAQNNLVKLRWMKQLTQYQWDHCRNPGNGHLQWATKVLRHFVIKLNFWASSPQNNVDFSISSTAQTTAPTQHWIGGPGISENWR